MKQVIRKETIIVKNLNNDIINSKLKFRFLDNENLRNVQLWGVQAFYGTQENGGQFPIDPDYSQDLITKDIFKHLFLTLYDKKNIEFCKQIPLVVLQTIQNQSVLTGAKNPNSDIVDLDSKSFTGQMLDLQNSYLELATTDLKPFQNYSLVLNFYYSRLDKDKILI